MCAVQGCGTSTVRYKGAVQVLCGTSVRYKYYTSNLTGPRAHNIIYFNICIKIPMLCVGIRLVFCMGLELYYIPD